MLHRAEVPARVGERSVRGRVGHPRPSARERLEREGRLLEHHPVVEELAPALLDGERDLEARAGRRLGHPGQDHPIAEDHPPLIADAGSAFDDRGRHRQPGTHVPGHRPVQLEVELVDRAPDLLRRRVEGHAVGDDLGRSGRRGRHVLLECRSQREQQEQYLDSRDSREALPTLAGHRRRNQRRQRSHNEMHGGNEDEADETLAHQRRGQHDRNRGQSQRHPHRVLAPGEPS